MSDDDRLGLTGQFWSKAKKMGLQEAAQLMWLAPARYHDYRAPRRDLVGLSEGDRLYAKLLVSRAPSRKDRGPLRLQVTDGKHYADMAIFGDEKSFKGLTVNSLIHVAGEVGFWNSRMQINNPQLVSSHQQGRLLPEYLPGESGLNQRTLAARIAQLIETHSQQAVAGLERAIGEAGSEVCRRLNLPFKNFEDLLLALHQPTDMEAAEDAKEALVHLAAYQALKLGLGAGARGPRPGVAMPSSVKNIDSLVQRLPFKLTQDQQRAAEEIVADLARSRPMRRVLSGDVGSGKTVSYMIPAVAAQRAGRQVVILMPNTLLAAQAVAELAEFSPGTPVTKLASGDKPPQSLEHKPIIIGTTAILHWLKKQDPRPTIDLAIIDEQQKLGAEQKRELIGPTTHVLEATATAIPRSQALVRYGISSISRIDEMPVQKHIETRFVDRDRESRRQVFNELSQIVNDGYQIAIVYPQREEIGDPNEPVSRRAVEQVQQLWEEKFPGKVGWIHGNLKSGEKEQMLECMRNGDYPIIITSSVIEIGVTIPSLKACMVVEAERYGATTLHQLRGRVARKGGDGFFYLMPSVPKAELKEAAYNRLELLVRTNNGLEIAEADLSARGFGELAMSGVEQTGFLEGYLPGIKVTPDAVNTVIQHLESSKTSVQRMTTVPAPF